MILSPIIYSLVFHPMYPYIKRLCYQDLWQQACYILLDAPAPLELYIEVFYHRTDIFIVEFFIKVVKSCLNWDFLLNMTLHGHRYIHIHLLLISRSNIAYKLSMHSSFSYAKSLMSKHGTLTISNQTTTGSSIVVQERITFLWIIYPNIYCCLIGFSYRAISSICTMFHGFSSTIFLVGRCP